MVRESAFSLINVIKWLKDWMLMPLRAAVTTRSMIRFREYFDFTPNCYIYIMTEAHFRYVYVDLFSLFTSLNTYLDVRFSRWPHTIQVGYESCGDVGRAFVKTECIIWIMKSWGFFVYYLNQRAFGLTSDSSGLYCVSFERWQQSNWWMRAGLKCQAPGFRI